MPTLASVNENAYGGGGGGGNVISLTQSYQPSVRPVRRCLFGKVSDDDRKRISQWLKTELDLHSAQQSAKWGFDFAHDQPLSPSPIMGVTLATSGGGDPDPDVLLGDDDDFEWVPCRADSVPEFYRSAVKPRTKGAGSIYSPSNTRLIAQQRADDERTPSKKKPSPRKPQVVPSTSIVPSTKTVAVTTSSAETNKFKLCLSTAEEVVITSSSTISSAAMKSSAVVVTSSGLSPSTVGNTEDDSATILGMSPVSDTTPQKPGESSTSSSSSSLGGKTGAAAAPKSDSRRNANGNDQTKLTSFYPLRKRSHRLSIGGDGDRVKMTTSLVDDHVIVQQEKKSSAGSQSETSGSYNSSSSEEEEVELGVSPLVDSPGPIKIPRPSSYPTSVARN